MTADYVTAAETGDRDSSVGKALAILGAFDGDGPDSLRVTDIALRVGIPKSTAFRLLAVLSTWKLIERQGTRYALGKQMFELGNLVSYCRPNNLRDAASPYLSDLRELSHQTVHLAVLDGLDVLYIAKLPGRDHLSLPSAIGRRVPAYRTALGKALLSRSADATIKGVLSGRLERATPYSVVAPGLLVKQLKSARSDGVAFDYEESALGVSCIGAPVLDKFGRAFAAISVSGPTGSFDPTRHSADISKAVEAVANQLETAPWDEMSMRQESDYSRGMKPKSQTHGQHAHPTLR